MPRFFQQSLEFAVVALSATWSVPVAQVDQVGSRSAAALLECQASRSVLVCELPARRAVQPSESRHRYRPVVDRRDLHLGAEYAGRDLRAQQPSGRRMPRSAAR